MSALSRLRSNKCPLLRLQRSYTTEFISFKPDKKLRWLPHLGTVHLELELEDRTIDANVPPLEAAFIELFSRKREHDVRFVVAQWFTI